MAITNITQTRTRNVTVVTVTSDLAAPVFYHWYQDGAYVGMTNSPSRAFVLRQGDQVRIDVNDTTDPDYDALANAPAGYPLRRTVWWIRSVATDVSHYRLEQQIGAGSFVSLGTVRHDAGLWSYSFLSPPLVDLTLHTWKVIPVDKAGNDGTALQLTQELIVRTPDAPDFTIAFDAGTTKVTFAAAA